MHLKKEGLEKTDEHENSRVVVVEVVVTVTDHLNYLNHTSSMLAVLPRTLTSKSVEWINGKKFCKNMPSDMRDKDKKIYCG